MFDHRRLAAALESVSSVPTEFIALEPGRDEPFHQEPGTRRSQDPRLRMFDAMIETVAHRGYDRTTLDRVLSVAKVPAPVFDEHFEDKQDCFLQALDELVGQLELTVLARMRRSAPWPERIRLGLEALLAALAENPDGARVAMVECLSAGEAAVTRLRSALAGFVPIFEEGRALASNTEHLSPQISTAVIGGIASVVHRRVLEGDTAELPTLLPDLLYFALMPYLGHPRALIAAGPGAGA
jgi:AcrR family transcriptional regulator